MWTIARSVGLYGINRQDDVRTVQELLNLVPHDRGGPLRRLKVDGTCGRKTNSAIEKLQAKHWGWGRVTTRVEAGSATWDLLLSFAPPSPVQAEAAAPAPVPPAKSTSVCFLFMQAASQGKLLSPEDYYFLVVDYKHQQSRALYYFGAEAGRPRLRQPAEWSQVRPGLVEVQEPIGADDWSGPAAVFEKNGGGVYETELIVRPDAGHRQARLELLTHMTEKRTAPGTTNLSWSAKFQLVDSSNRIDVL